MTQTEEQQPTRRRRRKARRAWMTYLRRLRKWCQTLRRVEDWQEIVDEAQKLLDEFGDAVPAENQRRIRNALKMTDATLAGAQQACEVLQTEVQTVIKLLGAGTVLTTAVVAALIVVAVVAAGVTIAANATAVDVRIINQGCQPLELSQLPAAVPLLRLAGVQLPTEPIEDGHSGLVTLPPVTVNVNAEDQTAVVFTVAGITLPRIQIGTVADVRFDNAQVLGRNSSFDLGEVDEHELVISCQ